MSSYAPYHTQPSTPISSVEALQILSDYLAKASNTPYLLPNCALTPTGPTSLDSTSNITIHNLKRVEAGLKGEWLGPSTLELETGSGVGHGERNDGITEINTNLKDGGQGREEEGWMDLDQYQREQSDIGESDTEMQPKDSGVLVREEDVNVVESKRPIDKEERKAMKKAKAKEEKSRREAEKRKKGGAA